MNPYQYVCELPVRKVTAAQEAIEKAILSLLEEKDLHNITVKEICGRANVARSTFYAYYDIVDDCLIDIENRFLKEIIVINEALNGSEKIGEMDLSFYEETIQCIRQNQKMLYLFMVKRYNHRFITKWKDAIKYHQYQRMPEGISSKNKELTLAIIAAQTIGAYQYWLENPYDLDVDYVKLLVRRTIEAYTER